MMSSAGYGSDQAGNDQLQLCSNAVWALGEVAICAVNQSGQIVGLALVPIIRVAIEKICGLLAS